MGSFFEGNLPIPCPIRAHEKKQTGNPMSHLGGAHLRGRHGNLWMIFKKMKCSPGGD